MSWKTGVAKLLSDIYSDEVHILDASYVGGGDINDARKIKTTAGTFFVKINSAARYPAMFEKEARGLKLLSAAGVIDVPQVVGFGEEGQDAFLVLHYIESGVRKSGFWQDFGKKMALLHQNTQPYFGLDHDNYIGSLPQSNRQHQSWPDFFREERLLPQIKMAHRKGLIDASFINMFDRFFSRLPALFPDEPPALVHGDLWGGNYMVSQNGDPVIIDPAVYYGHREIDLGMSQLFGGFDPAFYAAYHEHYPLHPGWQERLDYCNLYPLMVHVNLFGGGYVGSVRQILKRF